MAANQSFQELFRFQEPQQHQALRDSREGEQCPSCLAAVKPGADICESCGEWLLPGKCNFCYAEYKRDQKFCGNCGNPPGGIACKNCGAHSHFDFCPKCNEPLSRKAAPSLQALLDSPEVQMLKDIKQAARAPETSAKTTPADQLNQLNAYLKNDHQASAKTPANRFNFTGDNKDFSKDLEASQQSMQKILEENKTVDDTLLKMKIKELQKKAFSDNQAARLYYTSIKIMLPQLDACKSFLGWKCNYANFIHYAGPSDCACPSMGGHWVCKDDVKWVGANSFIYDGLTYTEGNEPKGIYHD